jgi:zinc transporter 9
VQANHEAEEDAAERRALEQSPIAQQQITRALWGNMLIASMKFAVYLQSGSSAVLSEAIHTLADCGNQLLLKMGHHEASKPADRSHPFGYGRAAFFWSLFSGVGIFLSGAGVAFGAALTQLMHPAEMYVISKELIFVMGFSFCVDGWVGVDLAVAPRRAPWRRARLTFAGVRRRAGMCWRGR